MAETVTPWPRARKGNRTTHRISKRLFAIILFLLKRQFPMVPRSFSREQSEKIYFQVRKRKRKLSRASHNPGEITHGVFLRLKGPSKSAARLSQAGMWTTMSRCDGIGTPSRLAGLYLNSRMA